MKAIQGKHTGVSSDHALRPRMPRRTPVCTRGSIAAISTLFVTVAIGIFARREFGKPSVSTGGEGWRACAKVRLLRSAAEDLHQESDATTNNCAGTDRDKSRKQKLISMDIGPWIGSVYLSPGRLDGNAASFFLLCSHWTCQPGVGFTRREVIWCIALHRTPAGYP